MIFNACGESGAFVFLPEEIEIQEEPRGIILQQRNREQRVDALAHTYIQLPIYKSTYQVVRDPF